MEHIEHFFEGDTEYEQFWLLDFAFDVFGNTKPEVVKYTVTTDQVVGFDGIVREIMNNKRLPSSTRIRAAYYLFSNTDYDTRVILRGVVNSLPQIKPSVELVRSLQSIGDLVPEATQKLKDFEGAQSGKIPTYP